MTRFRKRKSSVPFKSCEALEQQKFCRDPNAQIASKFNHFISGFEKFGKNSLFTLTIFFNKKLQLGANFCFLIQVHVKQKFTYWTNCRQSSVKYSNFSHCQSQNFYLDLQLSHESWLTKKKKIGNTKLYQVLNSITQQQKQIQHFCKLLKCLKWANRMYYKWLSTALVYCGCSICEVNKI